MVTSGVSNGGQKEDKMLFQCSQLLHSGELGHSVSHDGKQNLDRWTFLRAILPTTVGSCTLAMGRKMGSELHHESEFLHNHYTLSQHMMAITTLWSES